MIDSRLFYFGRSRFNVCHYSLPLGLNPEFWGTDICYPMLGFVIEGEYGITIIAKETKYEFNNVAIEINEVLKYGFNDEQLIALITDVDSNYYYIECSKNTNPFSKKSPLINIYDEKTEINTERYKWIDIKSNEKNINKLMTMRAYLMFFFIVLILVLIFYTIIVKRRNIK